MAYVLSMPLLCLLPILLYYARIWLTRRSLAQRYGCESPPKRPSRDPVLNLDCKMQSTRAARELKTLPNGIALHRRLGPTYCETSVFGKTLKTWNEENIRTVFGTKAKDWGIQPFRYEGMRPFCGEGLLSMDGPVWERSRALLKPSFNKNNIADLTAFEDLVRNFMKRIPTDGSTIDLDHLISLLFVDSATQFIIGQPLGMMAGDEPPDAPVKGKAFLKAFRLSLRGCGIRMYLGPFRVFLPRSATADHWKVVHQFIDFFVENALGDTKDDTSGERHSLMDGLISQTNDKIEIRNQVIQGMMAAQDTSASLLSNTVFLLSRNPGIWARLRAEVVFAGPAPLTLEDTKKSKLLRNILHESLRLYPVFPLLARDALVDTILPTGGGPNGEKPIFAPAGTRIVGDFWTLHRDESVYGLHPEKFIPDRWNYIQPSPWQFLAFGGGMRACLGQQKAMKSRDDPKYRRERLFEIGKRLAANDPPLDIVGLQECWTQEDYQAIRQETRQVLPHGKFYYSGIFGGGLAILSRWPIEESSMFRYPLNGRPTAFFRGDWFVGKGVACARIRMGPKHQDIVEVFCTHLHAPYEREPNDSYICHRTAQAWEIAKLMRGAAERGHLVLGLGDFNMVPLSFAHRLITSYGNVVDSWRALHPESSLGAAIDEAEKKRNMPLPTAAFNLEENGTTCDSVLNTWRWPKEKVRQLEKGKDVQILDTEPDPRAKRLDYIFVGNPQLEGLPTTASLPFWSVEAASVTMTERHPTLRCSLSDHFAVQTILTTSPQTQPPTKSETLSPSPPQPSPSPSTSRDDDLYPSILPLITTYTSREHRQRRLRLSHFLLSLFISICTFIAVWWSPHNSVAFVLNVVSTLGLAAGVVDGLIGGLFVGSEVRALREFEWEVGRRGEMEREGKGE
ncbi:MAG: hypothetical protein Q9227_002315 [Pyrenula ochraceoflavens]